MTEIFEEDVLIEGSDDVTQLRVQGYAIQNDALQTWEDSSGQPLAQVTADGRLQVGDDVGLASPDALIEAHRADTSTAKPKRGFHALGRVSDALNNAAQWIVQELEIRGSSNLSTLQTALRVRASNMNTGTPASGAQLRGADVEVINDVAAGSAALPKVTGLVVGVTNASGKTITEAVGLKVKLDNQGTITTPYAIFTEGVGATHLDDYLEMKRPAATPSTPATDFIRIYPKSDGNLYAKNWSGTETQLGGANFGSQTANVVFAGPASGGAAIPAFRALVASDLTGALASPPAIGGTTPNSGKFSEVGIGTTPSTKLHVLGHVSNESARFQARNDVSNNRSFISLYTTNPAYWWEFSNQDPSGGGTLNGLAFRERSNNASVERMYIASGGNVGINTTNPTTRLHIAGSMRVEGGIALQVTSPVWALHLGLDSAAKPNGGMWANSSDRRMKRNIEPYTSGLDFLQQLPNPVTYEYNGKGETPEGSQGTGFIAQELQKVAPSWVHPVKGKLSPEDEEETDLLYVNNSDMIFVLMNSVRELAGRVENLEAAS